jgi:formiminoglutamate deiminase
VERVRLIAADGRWQQVQRGVAAEAGDIQLDGLALPGFANTHSHAFHRALRGRTHDGGGTFWTWREAMYALAGRLEPDSYFQLARAVYAEMALAGISVVGEFHYLHHRPGGDRYPDPNAFGNALISAAAEAGIRITLLDCCYLSGGLDATGYLPLSEIQQRFSDGSATDWAARVNRLQAGDHARIGAAIHSVRAVPSDQLAEVVTAAGDRPLHVHVSEQPAENEVTRARFGRTPTGLLAEHGFGGRLHTAVHATHLSDEDLAFYARTNTIVSFCPTTERDLADGIGPAAALAAAGVRLTLGSDQNAVVDLLEEARALELNSRLATLQRGCFSMQSLVDSLTVHGHRSLGWDDAGELKQGQRADLVLVRLDTVRTAGALPRQVILAASAADVDTVVVDGRTIVSGGKHILGSAAEIGMLLAEAINPLWAD